MDKIYNLVSDGELIDELTFCIRNRALEQKFLYLEEGADLYYKSTQNDQIYSNVDDISNHDIYNFGNEHCFKKNKNIALISLGCGNSEVEKILLENLGTNYNIDYFAIDFSKEMLEKSFYNLESIKRAKHFMCVDFGSNNFRRELDVITNKYNEKIFCFFGNTFGNISHTNIIDILYNLLIHQEKIRLEVTLKSGNTTKDELTDFNFFTDLIHIPAKKKQYLSILSKYGVSKDDGDFSLSSEKIKVINATKFKYSFIFNKKIEIRIKSEKITILPGEEITLQQIYSYDANGLINFFKEHGFKLKNKQTKKLGGQFLFEKN